jgi:hypothetical protein
MGWVDWPLGVSIVHQHYPGFIDVMPNSQFILDAPDLRGSVQIISHVRPLVVTDFANELVAVPVGDARITRIARPIPNVADDAISADATGREGRSGPIVAIEKAVTGRIFFQDIYTEVLTCTEAPDTNESSGLQGHARLIERLVGTYRYLKPDPRLPMASDVPADTTPLRVGFYRYSDKERSMPFAERIQNASPSSLSLSIMSYKTASRALQDHERAFLHDRCEQLGSWLLTGFSLPDNLAEIERLADLAFNTGRLRAAIVEAMSILEAGILEARARASAAGDAPWAIRKDPDQLSMRDIVNKILPLLLKSYDGPVGDMVEIANEARLTRNKVVHKGHQPSIEETNQVLSSARKILSILELPDLYKGNYKRKA